MESAAIKRRFSRSLYLNVLLAALSSLVGAETEHAVRADTYAALKQAEPSLRRGDAPKAIKLLQALEARTRNDPFERAVVRQYLAFADAEAGDLRAARAAAESALKSNLLSADAVHALHYLAAQIAFREERYRDCAEYLGTWLEIEPNAGADVHYLAGYAAYRAEMPKAAATRHLEKAVAVHRSPPESWQRLLLSIWIDQKQYPKAEKLVLRLISAFPKNRDWWRFLTGLYIEQNRHDRALSSLMLAYYRGDAKPEQVMQLISLNAGQGYPAKAARMLGFELGRGGVSRTYKTLKLLSGCWQLARERDEARKALAEAAEMAKRGDDFVLLGRLEMQRGAWKAAEKALQRGLRTRGLKHRNQARLMLGIAAVNAHDDELARHTLQQLVNENAYKHEAAHWLNRLEHSAARR